MNTKHLKAKILDLAIRGKLVPQDSSEGNAADLLKEHNDIPEDEIPFEIPENWCWCKLDEIGETNIGLTYHPQDISADGIPVLRSNNINNNKLVLNDLVRVKTRILNNQYVKNGDILICARNGSKRLIGKCTILENLKEEMSFGAFMAIFRSNYNQYILRYLQSQHFKNYLRNSNSTQINQITQIMLKNCPLPLPPLSEQKRIVSAIEKAFEQIDIIEKNKLNLKTYIKQTKSKVLDLAIHGKLVKQNPNEGNAFELLEKIRKEKSDLIKQKKLKEDKKSSFIFKAEDGKHYEQFVDGTLKDIEDEIPFEIPENWCWCRLRELTTILGDGLHGSPKYNKNGEYYFINGNNLENGKIIIKSDTQKVDDTEYQKYKKELNDNTVLVSINGTIGNIAFYNNEKIILGKSACYFNLVTPSFKNYIYLLIKTSFFLVYATTNATGSTIKNVSLDTMRNFLLPLPPLYEQQRIVGRIEQIFEQLDILEKALGE